MKKFLTIVIALIAISSIFMFACKDDPDETFPAPEIVFSLPFSSSYEAYWTLVPDAKSYCIYIKDTAGNILKEIPVSGNEYPYPNYITYKDKQYEVARFTILDSIFPFSSITAMENIGVCAISKNNIYSPIVWAWSK